MDAGASRSYDLEFDVLADAGDLAAVLAVMPESVEARSCPNES